MGFVKGLHEGMINGHNFKWVMDITAVGMMILTATGIMLSIRVLRAQSVRRRKGRAAVGSS